MKISFIISNCPRKPTGGHKVLFEYINYLSLSNSVSIYFGYKEVYENIPFPIFIKNILAKVATKYIRPRWFKINRNVKRVCIKETNDNTISDADYVIATDVKTAFPTYKLSTSKEKKVYFIQDFENWAVTDEYVKETYRLNMYRIVVSNWLKQIVISTCIDDKVYLVSNSIDTSIFKVINGIERKRHSIVFQYRSAKNKGCIYAIAVVNKIKEIYSDLNVMIISNEHRNDSIPKWCKYYYNLSPYNVAVINNSAEVFVCTSINEGFGLPGLEAMACGCAVVSSEYNGIYEYAIDGENALLSPVGDVNTMVDNISRIFEDDDLRKNIIINGIETGKKKSKIKSCIQFSKTLVEINEKQSSKE